MQRKILKLKLKQRLLMLKRRLRISKPKSPKLKQSLQNPPRTQRKMTKKSLLPKKKPMTPKLKRPRRKKMLMKKLKKRLKKLRRP